MCLQFGVTTSHSYNIVAYVHVHVHFYIFCRKYYKSSVVTKSYNSSDVVRDLVSALQNYSQSPDTCKSLSFSNNQTWPRWRLCLVQWMYMYQAFFRHVQNYNIYLIFLYFKASFSTVELGCTAFNVWSMVWFFIKFWYFFFIINSRHRNDEAALPRLEGVQHLH